MLTKRTLNKLQVLQRTIERKLLRISIKDKITNQCIRQRTKVDDIIVIPKIEVVRERRERVRERGQTEKH